MVAEAKVVLLVHPPEVVVVVEFADDRGGALEDCGGVIIA